MPLKWNLKPTDSPPHPPACAWFPVWMGRAAFPPERKFGIIGMVHALMKWSGRWLFCQLLRLYKGLILAVFNTAVTCHPRGQAAPIRTPLSQHQEVQEGGLIWGGWLGGWRWDSFTSPLSHFFPIFPQTPGACQLGVREHSWQGFHSALFSRLRITDLTPLSCGKEWMESVVNGEPALEVWILHIEVLTVCHNRSLSLEKYV